MTELEKQIAVAKLFGYTVEGETATYKDMDASISGSCHVSELDMRDHTILWQLMECLLDEGKVHDITIYKDSVCMYYVGFPPWSVECSDKQESYIGRLFNAFAEASKYILEDGKQPN